MSNLFKESLLQLQQAANTRNAIKGARKETSRTARYSHHKKKCTSQRIKLKRQRERVYLSHFLSVKGIQPEHIICGEDDGKEPDFTLIINNQFIGIELTTLPRLRDRMGDKHLLQKRWYWKLRTKFTCIKSFFLKKRIDASKNSWFRIFQHLHFYHYYDAHHDHFTHHQTHHHHQNQHQITQNLQKDSALKETTFSPYRVKKSPTLVTFPNITTSKIRKLSFASNAWCYVKKYLKTHLSQPFNFFTTQTSKPDKPLSFITQVDMDAVMSKKAHKAAGYHRRRPLDALWLLVHTDTNQPDMKLVLPSEASPLLYHDSAFDAVWITVYPNTLSYKVSPAYTVKHEVAA